MTRKDGPKFSEKHGSNAKADPAIKEKIEIKAKNGQVTCAAAFQIAEELEVSPAEIGKTLDLLEMKLIKCQLGLFGYTPEKKIVSPKDTTNQDLKNAIQNALVNDRLPCVGAWEIAARFQVPKLTVSSIAEAMGVKIKPCQLGAF